MSKKNISKILNVKNVTSSFWKSQSVKNMYSIISVSSTVILIIQSCVAAFCRCTINRHVDFYYTKQEAILD